MQDSATASVRPRSREERADRLLHRLVALAVDERRRAARGSRRRRARAARPPPPPWRRARRGAGSCPGTRCGSRARRRSSRATSLSSSSSVDSPMPNVRSSVARIDAAARRPQPRREPRQHLLVHHPHELARHARQAEERALRSDLEHAAGAVPTGFGSTSAPSGRQRLLRVVSATSRGPRRAKKRADRRERRLVASRSSRPKALREHLEREVVARRAEPARDQHDVGAARARAGTRRSCRRGRRSTELWKRVSTSKRSSRSERNDLFESTISPRSSSSPIVRISAFTRHHRRGARAPAASAAERAGHHVVRAPRPRLPRSAARPSATGPRLPDIEHPERDESGHERQRAQRALGPPRARSGASVSSWPTHLVDHDAPVVLSVDPLGLVRRPDAGRRSRAAPRARDRERAERRDQREHADPHQGAEVPGAIGAKPAPAAVATASAAKRRRPPSRGEPTRRDKARAPDSATRREERRDLAKRRLGGGSRATEPQGTAARGSGVNESQAKIWRAAG